MIKAPAHLMPDSAERTYVVEINAGALVQMSGFKVSGPGRGSCTALNEGVTVVGGATLNLRATVVSHITNIDPAGPCVYDRVAALTQQGSGFGINIGRPPDQILNLAGPGSEVGHATISHVIVSDFQYDGIRVGGVGSTPTVEHSIVRGQGASPYFGNNGISIVDGALATVTHNTVLNVQCAIPSLCGPDIMSQLQAGGIVSFQADSAGVVAHNILKSNDVGLYPGCIPVTCTFHHNTIVDSVVAGLVIQDTDVTASHDSISGGPIGVEVVADAIDTHAVLRYERITGTSVAPIKEVSCCGFRTFVTVVPRPT